MKVNNYLIIDDQVTDSKQLSHQIEKFPFFKSIGIAPTLDMAQEFLISQRVDLIFLDIKLGNQSGLDLFKMEFNLPPVIITSAFPDFALQSYEIGKAIDYLLKPFSLARLSLALNRAAQTKKNAGESFNTNAVFLKMGRKIQRFNHDSIDYVEAFGIYSKVYAQGQMYLVNERLSGIVSLLPNSSFIRVQKSYLVNLNKVSSYDRNNIWLHQTKIPIGASYRPNLEALLALFDN